MFKRKKNDSQPPVTPQQDEAGQEVQFEKNIKTLWIYTTLFCAFALLLIVVSSLIQGKINSKAEYYQDQYENAQTSSQSTIKNIQDENAALKSDLDAAKKTLETLTAQSETDETLLRNSAEIIENAEYIINAQSLADKNKKSARDELAKVNPDILTEQLRESYVSLKTRLGMN